MKFPGRTIGGLLQGIMAGMVIFLAAFAILLIVQVDALRDRIKSRVHFMVTVEALQEETNRIVKALEEGRPRPEPREWTRRAGEVKVLLESLLSRDTQDDTLRHELLTVKADLELFGSRLGLRTTGRDALLHRARMILKSFSAMTHQVRKSNVQVFRQLGSQGDSLLAVMYSSLGLSLAVLILLFVSRGRSRRLNMLRAELRDELGFRTRAEKNLLVARDDLEDRVRRRTEALTTANRRLREEGEQRVRAQEEAKRIQAELVQAQKLESLGKLAGGVAHDFNNLLASIRGNTELLLARLDPADPRRRYGEDVVQATLRAETLTLQLLAFSRHQPFDPRPVDLNTLVQAFRGLLAPLLQEDVSLETDFGTESTVVHADPNQVEQILLNLAVNARDAMPEGGRIRITARRLHLDTTSPELPPDVTPGKYIRLSIEDSGSGIPDDILLRIFEPFYTTKAPGEGSGLGLSVVYGIVRHHGGWVDVETAAGQGTTFHVHLPASDSLPTPAPAPPPEVAGAGRGGERILVVEDEDGVRELAREVLFGEGYEVECAASLTEARTAIDDAPGFDLLFTDMALPDGDGLDLATELQEREPDLKVLLTSGYIDHLTRWPLIRERDYRLLRKPYLIAALKAAVREVLDG